jgi:hypothetical protein
MFAFPRPERRCASSYFLRSIDFAALHAIYHLILMDRSQRSRTGVRDENTHLSMLTFGRRARCARHAPR